LIYPARVGYHFIKVGQKSWSNLWWPADLLRPYYKDSSIMQVCYAQHHSFQAWHLENSLRRLEDCGSFCSLPDLSKSAENEQQWGFTHTHSHSVMKMWFMNVMQTLKEHTILQTLKRFMKADKSHFENIRFLQSLCYYFQNLEVIFLNSRHKTPTVIAVTQAV